MVTEQQHRLPGAPTVNYIQYCMCDCAPQPSEPLIGPHYHSKQVSPLMTDCNRLDY